MRTAAIIPATARIWTGGDGRCPALAEEPRHEVRGGDDQQRQQRQQDRGVDPGRALVEAAQLVEVVGPRVDREGEPDHDPADLFLVDDAELEGAPEEADLGGREADRGDARVELVIAT